jgi:hypothetical protein
MKIALCFIISYEHILNKETIWREWIDYNKDIINVYFYYKDINKIKSAWILQHTIPPSYIYETTYYHVMPAYLSIMNYVLKNKENQWICFLTDSCCPIVSPRKFRYLFYNYYNKSIISWKPSWWNIDFHKRANLKRLPNELHLANDPWFILQRENAIQCISFVNSQQGLTKIICNGGLANESLFAIIFYFYKELNNVINGVTHITDWSRMSSSTSPHLFQNGDETDDKFITKSIDDNKFAIFIRKITPKFPDDKLRYYIYEYSKEQDNNLVLKDPFLIKKIFLKYGLYFIYIATGIIIIYYFYF